MAKVTETQSGIKVNNIIQGTDVEGNISVTSGDFRIDGTLKGNLKTTSKVIIGSTGSVTGEVKCKNADIEGKVEGKIIVQELLTLKATSVILGDMVTKRLAIEPGAKFTGNCNMTQGGGISNEKAPEAPKFK